MPIRMQLARTNYEHFSILHIFACRMPQKKIKDVSIYLTNKYRFV